MSTNIEPIRQGIRPELDAAREMLQFVAEQINDYIDENGESPVSIAFVLAGRDYGDTSTVAQSWSPGDEDRSRLHCCAVASTVLMKRALGL